MRFRNTVGKGMSCPGRVDDPSTPTTDVRVMWVWAEHVPPLQRRRALVVGFDGGKPTTGWVDDPSTHDVRASGGSGRRGETVARPSGSINARSVGYSPTGGNSVSRSAGVSSMASGSQACNDSTGKLDQRTPIAFTPAALAASRSNGLSPIIAA